MHIHRDMFGYASAAFGLPSTQTGGWLQLAAGGDPDGDADGSTGEPGAAGASGANPIMQALAQALQSLGLALTSTAATASPPGSTATPVSQANASTTAATAASPPAAAGGTVDPHAVRSIARDIRHVMRALFTDIQAENMLAPASAGAAASSPTPQSSFGSGLAALISQIQGGSVPANLQNAFDKLVSDLGKTDGAAGASTSAAPPPPTATAAPAPTPPSAVAPSAASTASPGSTTASAAGGVSYQGLLLQFLTNLQSDLGLGYGVSSSATAQGATSGLIVNTLA
jgi:hypothetical protein